MALLKNVSSVFCHISSLDSYSGKYQIVVSMTEEQAADAEEAGLNVKVKEFDGQTQFQATFKTKFKVLDKIKGRDGVTIVDLEGAELPRGAKVNVQYGFRNWENSQNKTKGVSQDLLGIQVLELGSIQKNEFEDMDSAGGDTEGDM